MIENYNSKMEKKNREENLINYNPQRMRIK
jgi:hypothetical protein